MNALAEWVRQVEAACADGRPEPLAIVRLLRQVPPHTRGRLAEVVRRTRWSYGYVSSLSWLASHLAEDAQRDEVSLKTQFAVSGLPVEQQRRRLAEAATEGLTSAALCRRINAEVGR